MADSDTQGQQVGTVEVKGRWQWELQEGETMLNVKGARQKAIQHTVQQV
jgi:hypothetical protein